MSPMPGIFCIVLRSRCCSAGRRSRTSGRSPARSRFRSGACSARECGSRAATTALSKSSVLTSGRTLRWTRSPLTVGVKFRRMPNSLNMTLMADVARRCPARSGIGNSPPARKLASLPLSATRFGSARLWNNPRVCSALMTAPRLLLGVEEEQVEEIAEHELAVLAVLAVESARGTAASCCGRDTPSL